MHFCYTDDPPTMEDLTKIRDRIGKEYTEVGTCLLKDSTGKVMEVINHDNKKLKEKLEDIFRRWINGEGKKCSREEFINCLKFAKLNALAEDLELACARENKHTDRQTETFSSLPSSTPAPHAKEKEHVNEQLKQENDMESSTYVMYVIFSVIIASIIAIFCGFECDSTPGTEFPSQMHVLCVSNPVLYYIPTKPQCSCVVYSLT